jgi:hypothetical protein
LSLIFASKAKSLPLVRDYVRVSTMVGSIISEIIRLGRIY